MVFTQIARRGWEKNSWSHATGKESCATRRRIRLQFLSRYELNHVSVSSRLFVISGMFLVKTAAGKKPAKEIGMRKLDMEIRRLIFYRSLAASLTVPWSVTDHVCVFYTITTTKCMHLDKKCRSHCCRLPFKGFIGFRYLHLLCFVVLYLHNQLKVLSILNFILFLAYISFNSKIILSDLTLKFFNFLIF